jgi:hypothetical protein
MTPKPTPRTLGLFRRHATYRLLFELLLVATVTVGGIWIIRHSNKTKLPPQDGFLLTDDHVIVVKTKGGDGDTRGILLTYSGGQIVDLNGWDSGLTDPTDPTQIHVVGNVFYARLHIVDPENISASELRHAITCITRAIPPGKKCHLKVLLL